MKKDESAVMMYHKELLDFIKNKEIKLPNGSTIYLRGFEEKIEHGTIKPAGNSCHVIISKKKGEEHTRCWIIYE